MGAGASSAPVSETPGGDLKLPAAGLKFTSTQLRSLNGYVDNMARQDQVGRMTPEVESVVESLVQRIVDGAGQRDPRFRCCHLIALHKEKKMRSRSLEYLVTLDALPPLNTGVGGWLQESPPGYGKVKLTGELAETWEDFITSNGYLCRDKVLERWVELIAKCAHARGGGGSRVLSTRAAMRAQPYHYCYMERVAPPSLPSDPRLAIVEGAAWVTVRVGASEAEAKLMLALRVEGCSALGHVTRVPLTQPMALLHYSASLNGFFAVAVGPPTSIVCSERQSTWQLWHPGLEAVLDSHCSSQSTVGRIARAVNAQVDCLRDGLVIQGTLRVLSRFAVTCAYRRRLDSLGRYFSASGRACLSTHSSHHFLLILDSLIAISEGSWSSGYVYDLDRSCVSRRAIRANDTDWSNDANVLRRLITHLHNDSAKAEDIPPSISESLELVLFGRWESILKETRAGSSSVPSFSRRQLRYLWTVANQLIECKKKLVVENQSNFRANLIQATTFLQIPVEDLIHIMAIILDQARDMYMMNNFYIMKTANGDRGTMTFRSKKWNKLKEYYDASSACLIDTIRRDPDLRKQDLTDPIIIMRHTITWLYKGAKEDKKYLGPVLKPYLERLYVISLENSWFLEEYEEKRLEKEFEGLKTYCLGVHEGKVDACSGLMEAAKKLGWAKTMVDFVDRTRHVDLRLVFPHGKGMAVSYPITLPSRRDPSSRALTLTRRDKAEAKLKLAERCVLAAFAEQLTSHSRSNTKVLARYSSTDEILNNIKSGHYWRNGSKPDIIPSSQESSSTDLPMVRRRSRRNRPATAYGFPEISIKNDSKTLRRKYHTLRSLVYSDSVDNLKEFRPRRPRSAGSSIRHKAALTKPTLLETLDFINGVKDNLCVEDSGTSDTEVAAWNAVDDWSLGQTASLNVLARLSAHNTLHWSLGDVLPALLHMDKYTIIQELCSWLGESSEAALFALHRLARVARSRSTERSNTWRLPESEEFASLQGTQRYRARPIDYVSGDEAPQPPPLPRSASRMITQKKNTDFVPPKRLQDLENHLKNLELMQSKLNQTTLNTRSLSPTNGRSLSPTNGRTLNSTNTRALSPTNTKTPNPTNGRPLNPTNGRTLNPTNTKTLSPINTTGLRDTYTGILNPIYDIKIPKDRFAAKRSKSLGRSFSTKKIGLDITRYNLTLGYKKGRNHNDIVQAISGMSGETGLGEKGFFQKYSSTANVIGDSYRISKVSID